MKQTKAHTIYDMQTHRETVGPVEGIYTCMQKLERNAKQLRQKIAYALVLQAKPRWHYMRTITHPQQLIVHEWCLLCGYSHL